jgi:cell division protein FtsI/penicillin-binding protein 2
MWSLAVLLVMAYGGLGYRLVHLQVVRHEELLEKARRSLERTFFLGVRRGDIRDCKGNQLATCRLAKTVCADPTLISNVHVGNRQRGMARVLAPLLLLPEEQLINQFQVRLITNTVSQGVPDQYVVLKRNVSVEQWETVRNALLRLTFGVDEQKLSAQKRAYYKALRTKAIFAEDSQVRVYPNLNLACHILGHVGLTQAECNERPVLEITGKDGIELTFNSALAGTSGWRRTEVDARGRELVTARKEDVPPRPGLNVVLTIDSRVQQIVEAELALAMQKHDPISAVAIVVQPQTGAILAMCTLPNFDPNNPGAADADHLRNRAVCDLAEPGSTFKIVGVTGSLDQQVVSLQDQFYCEQGSYYYAGRRLTDHHPYGWLTVEEIIVHSSNIGAAKIGMKFGPDRLYQYIRSFGFGDRTGISLLGERSGTVYPVDKWTKGSVLSVAIGYEVAVTPLQMVMAMSALANGGRLMRPMLVDRLEDDQGRVVVKYQSQMIRQVCSKETARLMVSALKSAVGNDGTGRKAQLDHFSVAGKTGTSIKANVHGHRGYYKGYYFSSFVGFFPADQPELCIYVVLDEPQHGYYGGDTAAVFFRSIADRTANYLGLQPDFFPGEKLAGTSVAGGLTNARTD